MNNLLPALVVITGAVASGKTTLAQRLAADLSLPLLHRDTFQERLFEIESLAHRVEPRVLGIASYSAFYYAFEVLLQTGSPFIIESNFQSRYANTELNALLTRYAYRPFQLHCHLSPEDRYRRFCQRIHDGTRHLGYGETVEDASLDRFRETNSLDLLDLAGPQRVVDTTSTDSLQFALLLEELNRFLGHP